MRCGRAPASKAAASRRRRRSGASCGGRSAGLRQTRRRRLRHCRRRARRRRHDLCDRRRQRVGPDAAGLGSKAVALWHRLKADALVAEINQGGDMVKAVIGAADRAVPVLTVHATRGKYLRAEPVSQLYEQGRQARWHFSGAGGRDVRLRLDGLFGAARPTGSTRWCGR